MAPKLSMNRFQTAYLLPSPETSPFFVLLGRVLFAGTLIISLLSALGIIGFDDFQNGGKQPVQVVRLLVALSSAAFLVASFLSGAFRKNIYQYLLGLIYLASFVTVFQVYASGFEIQPRFILIIVTLLGSVFFFDRINLLIYQGAILSGILLAVIMHGSIPAGLPEFAIHFVVFHTIVHFVISFRIKISQELREKDMRFRHMFENLKDGVVYVDKGNQIRLANEFMEKLSGYAVDELIGKADRELLQGWKHLLADGVVLGEEADGERHESYLIRRDGSRIWVSFSVAPVSDEFERPDGYVAIISDITEQKKAQVELRRTAEKLSQTNKELEQFSYFASHDLQAPLETIQHYARQIQGHAHAGKEFTVQDREAIEVILEDSRRMSKLIDALLLYSSSGTSSIEKTDIDMNRVLAEARENLAAYIEKSNATVESESLPLLMGDSVQLTRLMQNLISNAIRYRRDEPPIIRISVSLNESASAHVFSVQDNGVGIDNEEYQRVFRMFQQLSPNGGSGLGVGLAICKRIVENHNGSIWLKSIKGKGTTIFFSLPTE